MCRVLEAWLSSIILKLRGGKWRYNTHRRPFNARMIVLTWVTRVYLILCESSLCNLGFVSYWLSARTWLFNKWVKFESRGWVVWLCCTEPTLQAPQALLPSLSYCILFCNSCSYNTCLLYLVTRTLFVTCSFFPLNPVETFSFPICRSMFN